MWKAVGLVATTLLLTLIASVAVAVTIPSQANQHAVDATQTTSRGADVTGHPNATVNQVPPGPPAWLNASAPFGPPKWVNTSGGPPTWLTPP